MKRDVQQEITDRVVRALEEGVVPWQQPWSKAALPTSVSTGRPYRGINFWLLSLTATLEGYTSPLWLTFRQATELGGAPRKGQKATLVVFWKILEVERDGEQQKIPMLRHYNVFNVEQCDGLTLPPRLVKADEQAWIVPTDAVTAIVDGYAGGPRIVHAAQDSAFYAPSTDVVTLPALEQFSSVDGYAATLFHELTHSTGHPSRLDRFVKTGEPAHFGSALYAREELVAQMGASMLAARAGTDPQIDNSAAYIGSWLEVLRGDAGLVIHASQDAQRAVDLIVGESFAKEAAA